MKKFILLSMIIGMTFVSCKSEEEDTTGLLGLLSLADTNTQPTTDTVAVNFAVVSGTTPVDCSTDHIGVANTSTEFKLNDMRFYVSEIKLLSGNNSVSVQLDDNSWQNQNVALIDLEDATGSCTGTAATNSSLTGSVEAGSFDGIEFTVGVPVALNHVDAADAATPAPFNVIGMFWTWLDGYKFMRFDYTADTLLGNFHLGSRGCGGTVLEPTGVCTYSNRATIRLTKQNFAANGETIKLDIQELLSGIDITTADGTMYSVEKCHSNVMMQPGCASPFSKLGVSAMDGSSTPANQTAFSIQ